MSMSTNHLFAGISEKTNKPQLHVKTNKEGHDGPGSLT